MKRIAWVLISFALCLSVWAQNANAPAVKLVATTAAQGDTGNPNVKVWVNTNSGVYHCPGTRWYGATKSGEYMSQAEAQKKGYRPAYGRVCR